MIETNMRRQTLQITEGQNTAVVSADFLNKNKLISTFTRRFSLSYDIRAKGRFQFRLELAHIAKKKITIL